MRITELAVKKPSAIIMIIILILIMGAYSYNNLGVNLFPNAEIPILSISTVYPGAGVDDVKREVVKVIEDALSSVNGADTMRSGAIEAYGYTVIQFKMDANMNTAMIDVQKALDSILSDLPKDCERPVIRKQNKSDEPIMVMALSGNVSYDEIKNQASNLKREMEKLEGVSSVSKIGELDREVEVMLDKNAMEFYKISINTVIGILKANNTSLPAGKLNQQDTKVLVRINGEFESIEDINGTHIPIAEGKAIRLDDIAKVTLKYADDKSILRSSGNTGIGISIKKQSDANVVEVGERIKNEMEIFRKTLPEGIRLIIADDTTRYVNMAISGIKKNLIEGIIITALVMFLFLKNWRTAVIVLVAIPTSLSATFLMMYTFNFTLNLISLLALSISIGILVDDSIVIIENIQRHIRKGTEPIRAAIEGRYEIGMAAISITLCDIVVFAPISFMSGIVGKFFKEFGLTVVCATAFSLFVSFTITPMLASRMLKKENVGEDEESANKKKKENKLLTRAIAIYEKSLRWSLNNRLVTLLFIVALIVLSVLPVVFGYIGSEFIPSADQSRITIDIKLNPNATLKVTDEATKKIEKHIKDTYKEAVEDFYTVVGLQDKAHTARMIVLLTDKKTRTIPQSNVAKELRDWGRTQPGVVIEVSELSMVGQTSMDGSKPLIINITGPNLEILKGYSKRVEEIVKQTSGTVDVENSVKMGQNEIRAKFDRLAASEYGITAADVATSLRAAISGVKTGIYRDSGSEYDIMVKFDQEMINKIELLGSVKVQNSMGTSVELNKLVSLSQGNSMEEMLRQDRKERVYIASNIQGRVLGDITKDIDQKLKGISLSSGYTIEYGGDQKNTNESFSSLVFALFISVFLVYAILVILYGSYLSPFIRMLSLPVGIIGALLALTITKSSLNIISMIGIIMLDALVAKNGTLLIDYTNTLIKQGLSLKDALIKAGTTRITPIIMTSVAMISGMLPTVLSTDDGAESKVSMGIVLIGGLITSTMLSPILIPIVYTLIEDVKYKIFKKKVTGD